ncbi:Cof-type HAD-IIB family hydrolase [Clostridium septicum]|uniref:Cof-type HAD-IIB family hydrolase n=1 Tax=Clostridium septicum TaxID=1504 RepID=A0A9N7PKU8_CLOSE|nr:Cof-type HAD-IIB family hydrolase [Clostridium septicum]AYE33901.1 Cof-type HAD-IIB family hydrolase [Clostridium septicum]MDU1312949.1 Cof-type HAD-IIB family hydrolase [Clostridium septicum]QAS62052.1 Cof-type HAD-IIB family hydrolase [Clostridium septicum]UEC21492.1 Cof-type HAD-IIB family hydrolase [Clostridium septicum]USS00461.1 Cof-type HAD-IIB family hydrolase [Clostridium septicum]
MSNYKLICIDMDGTLLDDNHKVSNENKLALKAATEKGVKVAITTGRIFCSAKYYSDLIGVDAPVIASNGAYVREKNSDKPIFENPLPAKILHEVYSIIRKYGLHVNLNTSDTVLRETEVPKDHAYAIMNKNLPDDQKIKFIISEDLTKYIDDFNGQILKAITIEEENIDALFKAKEELKEKFKDELHIVSSSPKNFEVMLGTSSKGNAVKKLAENFGLSPENVICIGDSENDLSMLRYAGLGVAMGNGLDIVKEEADFITDTNLNSGVAKVIEKFVL